MSIHDTPLLLGASPGEALVHCVFIHGRTQSPEDMQEQVIAKLRMPGVCFVLPRARGNSWYDARATDVLTDRTRQQLDQAVEALRRLHRQVQREALEPQLGRQLGGQGVGHAVAAHALFLAQGDGRVVRARRRLRHGGAALQPRGARHGSRWQQQAAGHQHLHVGGGDTQRCRRVQHLAQAALAVEQDQRRPLRPRDVHGVSVLDGVQPRFGFGVDHRQATDECKHNAVHYKLKLDAMQAPAT